MSYINTIQGRDDTEYEIHDSRISENIDATDNGKILKVNENGTIIATEDTIDGMYYTNNKITQDNIDITSNVSSSLNIPNKYSSFDSTIEDNEVVSIQLKNDNNINTTPQLQTVDGVDKKIANLENVYAEKGDIPQPYSTEQLNGYLTKESGDTLYVGKETNKGLSTNDFTTAYKDKLDNIPTIIKTGPEDTSGLPTSDVINATLQNYAQTDNLSQVATTGSYNDLSDTPTLSDVATTGDYNDLNNKPTLSTVATTGSYDDLSNTPVIPQPYSNENTSGYLQRNSADDIYVSQTTTINGNALNSDITIDIPQPYSNDNPNGYLQKTQTDALYVSKEEDVVTQEELNLTLENYTLLSALSDVATTGDYNDLNNKPIIGEAASRDVLDNFENLDVQSDTRIPTASAVYDFVGDEISDHLNEEVQIQGYDPDNKPETKGLINSFQYKNKNDDDWTTVNLQIAYLDGNYITGDGVANSLAKFVDERTVTSGPQFTSGGTRLLQEDGSWVNFNLNIENGVAENSLQQKGANATGANSFAGGSYADYPASATGTGSFAFGNLCVVNGNTSAAFGSQNSTDANQSFVGGSESEVHKQGSIAFGQGVRILSSASQQQAVFGRYNADNNNAILILGNGNSDGRKNAFEFLRDGKIVINRNIELTPPNASGTIATKAQVDAKQDNLVSGTNIKTINNTSLLGSGNITIPVSKTYISSNDPLTISSVTPQEMSAGVYNDWDSQHQYHWYVTITDNKLNGLTTNSLIENIVMTDTLLETIAPVITTGQNSITFYTETGDPLSVTIFTLIAKEV